MDEFKKLIREVPDFPKPGILFYDITTLLKHRPGFCRLIDYLTLQTRLIQADFVLGIEARGFIFAAEEDFGIAPVEAQACGTPVVAYGRGGALETIRGLDQPEPSGVFFKEQTVGSLREAIQTLEEDSGRISAENCRRNAERFGPERFQEELGGFMEAAWEEFSASLSRR